MTRRIIAATIDYVDSSSSPQAGTLYLSTESFTTNSSDTPANTHFDGRLSGDIDFEYRVAAPFTRRKSVSGFGKLRIANADGNLDDALTWVFRDGSVVIKSLEVGQDWDDGEVLVTAIADRIEADGLTDLVLQLRDPAAVLEQSIQTESYTTGSGFDDAAGKLKPVSFGTPLNCKPVNSIYSSNRFDIHDAEIVDVAEVRIDGAPTDAYTVVSAAASSGVLLDSEPAGEVTIDPVATGTGSLLSVVKNSPVDFGILYSNLDRTVQNSNRISDSPQTNMLWTSYANSGKSMSAGGKYYFEVVIHNNSALLVNATYFPDGRWGCATGIGLVPSVNASPNGADQYTLWCGDSSNSLDVYTWEDTTGIDSGATIPGTFSWGGGDVIGVLVNFDDAEVTFKVNDTEYTSSVLDITQNSPLDTFYPLAAVSGSNNTDSRDQDSKMTLYLQPEKFTYDLPAGYSAWGDSAYAASTEFSDLVSSITDRISGVTVDTVTQAEIDALGYSYSYYAAQAEPASQILWEACAGFSGWYYVNRLGSLAFGRLQQPTSGGVAEFTDAEIISIKRISKDNARGLSNRMGALRNYTAQSRGTLDDSLTESKKETYSRQYQHEVTDDTALATAYAHAENAEILGSLFRTSSNADDEIERLNELYQTERLMVELDVAFDIDQYTSLYMGAPVTTDLSRYGLDSSLGLWILMSMRGNFSKSRARVVLWGGWSSDVVPAAPTALTATTGSSDGEIDLVWTNNATNATGIKVQRSANVSPLSFSTVATIGASETTYTDTGLGPTTYHYRIVATNSAGDSAASNVDSATATGGWEYATYSAAVASGDPWANNDEITITGTSPNTLFVYKSANATNGGTGLRHRYPLGDTTEFTTDTVRGGGGPSVDPDTFTIDSGSWGGATPRIPTIDAVGSPLRSRLQSSTDVTSYYQCLASANIDENYGCQMAEIPNFVADMTASANRRADVSIYAADSGEDSYFVDFGVANSGSTTKYSIYKNGSWNATSIDKDTVIDYLFIYVSGIEEKYAIWDGETLLDSGSLVSWGNGNTNLVSFAVRGNTASEMQFSGFNLVTLT